MDCINVETPVLKKLTVLLRTKDELSVSVVAPVLEEVSWECSSYSTTTMTAGSGFGAWGLSKLSLHPESLGHRVITGAAKDTCRFDAELNFVQKIEEHLVTDFSVLELIMEYGSTSHVFGPFVFHLLGSHRIRAATRRLQILLLSSKEKEECALNCPCNEPKNWRSKNISLIILEEVVIDGFECEDHEFDFLKAIFRCAPMLKRMVVGTSTSNS
ncbi:hypothetical protein QYE76_071704 [Lolium multiflorum]|uniref:FBD domain-containing protein n=1 Tax=Lolium multiflorum TaxID=4521 RepID=A0AAD8WH31_LOLMU|nr:hypothetical protein QYE76_071704 [Lolium multiflorum]